MTELSHSTLEMPLAVEPTVAIAAAATDSHGEPLRVALLTNEIPPYRVPLYRELAATPNWDFHVLTCVDREHSRQWAVEENLGFSSRRSKSYSYMRRVPRIGAAEYCDQYQVHIPVGLWGDLRRLQPDVIISSELGARTVIAAAYAKAAHKTLCVYYEGTPHTDRQLGFIQRWIRRALRNAPHAFLSNGSQGRIYLESLGVSQQRIFEIGQALDTTSFDAVPDPAQRDATRTRLNVSGICYLFVGRLVPGKGLSELFDAWKAFCQAQSVDATLLLVGDGEQRDELEQMAANSGLDNVRFLGFLQREELPEIYQAADVFVLPSLQDCWALVTGEALASGLPVIDSIYNGGAEELVDEGENGWITDPLDHADLTSKLELAYHAHDRKPAMAALSREKIAQMSVERVAQRIRDAIAQVHTTPTKSTGEE